MTLYSDSTFMPMIEAGIIGLEPYDPTNVQPASIDVTLSPELVFTHKYTMDGPFTYDLNDFGDGFPLKPEHFALGCTVETLRLPSDVAARFEGKSTLGRQGLVTHITAGFIDPGFEGQITVELACLHPQGIRLYAGMKIGQICFYELDRKPRAPYGDPLYGNHYQGQRGPTAARKD